MSKLDFLESQESPKHCASKQGISIKKSYKKLVCTISSITTTILLLILLVWLTLHPEKPQFSVEPSNLTQFNLTAPQLLNSSVSLTLTVNNPNKKVSIYYDDLTAYAAYNGERITADTSIPPLYQDHEEKNKLSAYLIGNGLPVGPFFGNEVRRDQAAGQLHLNLKLNGKLKWKVGTWISGWYRFNVNCDATLDRGPTGWTGVLGTRQGSHCSTSV